MYACKGLVNYSNYLCTTYVGINCVLRATEKMYVLLNKYNVLTDIEWNFFQKPCKLDNINEGLEFPYHFQRILAI